MLKANTAYSSFSVDDLSEAKEFYSEVLRLDIDESEMGLVMKLPGGGSVFVYEKEDHLPATYTVLNFEVEDIDAAVHQLTEDHVVFEKYEGITDENCIARGIDAHEGPDMAWFKDHAGNILSLIQPELA